MKEPIKRRGSTVVIVIIILIVIALVIFAIFLLFRGSSNDSTEGEPCTSNLQCETN